jgi:hypothetical protein
MAKKTFEQAQSVSEYVAGLVRKRALKAIADHDATLASMYTTIAAGIRRDLKATGYTVEQIKDVLEKNLGSTKAERLKIMEAAITDAAKEARTIDRETFEAVFGAEEAGATVRPLGRPLQRGKVLSMSRRRRSEDDTR